MPVPLPCAPIVTVEPRTSDANATPCNVVVPWPVPVLVLGVVVARLVPIPGVTVARPVPVPAVAVARPVPVPAVAVAKPVPVPVPVVAVVSGIAVPLADGVLLVLPETPPFCQ